MSYQQIIYNKFRQFGLTEAGTLGLLGNFQEESGCEPNRLENDFDSYRRVSKEYVASATSGKMTKTEFCKAIGFGIAQWTFPSRKANLWEFWKSSGKALDNVYMQIEFVIKELKHDFPELWKLLCTSNDMYTCVKRVCYDFENPQIKNIDTRFRYANEIKNSIELNKWEDYKETEQSSNVDKIEINHKLNLRTVDKNCYNFTMEIYLIQTLLALRNYGVIIDGIWGESSNSAILEFQKDNNLVADGIVGPKTWAKLLER